MPAEARDAAVSGASPPDDAPGRRVTPRGALSRDRIVAATLDLLAEGGYAALSISAVCKRAEVSPASLYHHFGDKAGLVSAVIEESAREGARRFAEQICDHERPLDQLEAFLAVTREIGASPTNPVAVLFKAAEALGAAPELAGAIAETRTRVWRFVAAEFADHFGIEDGMLFAHLLFSFMTYLAHLDQSSAARSSVDGGSGPDRAAIEAVFSSYRRILLVTVAAVRPDFLGDPLFAAAVAEASQLRLSLPADVVPLLPGDRS